VLQRPNLWKNKLLRRVSLAMLSQIMASSTSTFAEFLRHSLLWEGEYINEITMSILEHEWQG